MKKPRIRKILDCDSCEGQSKTRINETTGEWYTTDDIIMPAGFVDCECQPDELQPNGEKFKQLQALDVRLRTPQRFEDRSRLYREIIQSGDLGNGWALGFDIDEQSQEFINVNESILQENIKQLKPLAADAENIRSQQASGRSKGATATKAKAEANKQEIRKLFLLFKEQHPRWDKKSIQREVSKMHPRKRGFSLRTIQSATKDL